MSLATKPIVTEKRFLEAMIALLSLKFAAIAALALSAICVVLFVFYLIFQAIYQLGSQLAQLWAECSAIEKLIFLVIAWAFLAWVFKQVKGLRHAA